MTREELEMRTLDRESDVIDSTDGSELAKAFNYLWEKYVEQEPCEDAVSKQGAIEAFQIFREYESNRSNKEWVDRIETVLNQLPPVTPQPKTGHCKDCKYFEYDSVAKVDGILLILAHEICSRWGKGCKTKEDGYCFLFEPQESEGI